MRYLQNARKSREAWKLQVKALGWAWGEQLARFTALSSNHRQMNGHRPCFIWAGLMPGLWTHWQGQINHTSFSLGLENIEERKNERAKGGWKTLPPAGWASVLFSARGMIWYYSRLYPATEKTYQNYAEKNKKSRDRHITLKETSYWERNWYRWAKREIHTHKTYKKYSGSSHTMESDAGTWYLFMVFAWYSKVL